MDNLIALWNRTSPRDQIMMMALGAVIAIYLLYAAVLSPVKSMRDKEEMRYKSSMVALEEVRTLAAKWVASQESSEGGGARGESMVQIINSTANQQSLRLAGIQPSGANDVRLRMENVNFDSFLNWMQEMETTRGMQVKDLSVSSGSNPGTVSINLRLHRN